MKSSRNLGRQCVKTLKLKMCITTNDIYCIISFELTPNQMEPQSNVVYILYIYAWFAKTFFVYKLGESESNYQGINRVSAQAINLIDIEHLELSI